MWLRAADIEEDDPHKWPLWHKVMAWSGILFLCLVHFYVCVFLMIRYRTEKERTKAYQYYSPWGWGSSKENHE